MKERTLFTLLSTWFLKPAQPQQSREREREILFAWSPRTIIDILRLLRRKQLQSLLGATDCQQKWAVQASCRLTISYSHRQGSFDLEWRNLLTMQAPWCADEAKRILNKEKSVSFKIIIAQGNGRGKRKDNLWQEKGNWTIIMNLNEEGGPL